MARYRKKNGNWYNITDDAAQNYSTEEQIIGTWIDGKPLYRRIFQYTSFGEGATDVNHNIQNIDSVINIRGIGFNPLNKFINIPQANADPTYNVGIMATTTQIQLRVAQLQNPLTNVSVFLEYTKTTD